MNDKKVDNVNPNHYQGTKCIEFMTVALGEVAVSYFCLGNAFKYLWRYKDKNKEEDIKKARWYLDYVSHYIELEVNSISEDVLTAYYRLNDLYITITDRIANHIE